MSWSRRAFASSAPAILSESRARWAWSCSKVGAGDVGEGGEGGGGAGGAVGDGLESGFTAGGETGMAVWSG